jgi:hypothetical protein
MRTAIALLLLMWAADVTGEWAFTVETDQGAGNPSFTFKQDGEKLTGAYTGMFGSAPISGTVKGEAIEFRFKVDYGGQTGEMIYTGTITSATEMTGKVQLVGLGEGTWTGKKK